MVELKSKALPWLLLLLLGLSGCPWFKNDETKEQETKASAASVTASLTKLAGRYPHAVARLRQRWKSARPRYDKALKIASRGARVAAMKRALDPVTRPLFSLEAFERHSVNIGAKLAQLTRLPAARRAAYAAAAKRLRRALMTAKLADAELDARIKKAEDAQSARYFELQRMRTSSP